MARSIALKLGQAARTLTSGGVIAYPSEAVYGLGCDPWNPDAVARILTLKQRPLKAGLILIASNPGQLTGWIMPGPEEEQRLYTEQRQVVTWVISADPGAPDWITGGRDSVAVRLTRHGLSAALCEAAGMALVSTSANRRGHPPAKTALGVRRMFGAQIDLVLAGSTGGKRKPSEIRDARTGAVLRAGGG
jgi:L-threonylcarbamoyladenylate synthase